MELSSKDIEDRFGPFLKLADIDGVLYFVGEILSGDVEHFRRATREHDIDTVVLMSPGGIVNEGLELANIFQDRNITAYVPSDYVCASACAFMFFGASRRLARGAIGVHQFNKNNPRAEENESFAQALSGRILEHLNGFGTPTFVVERMLATPPSEMHWMDTEELGLINSSAADIPDDLLLLPAPRFQAVFSQQVDKEDTQPSDEEITRAIQAELNRLGCDVGTADGVPGRKTRQGLQGLTARLGLEYDEDLLVDAAFLERIKTLTRRVCPAPVTPLAGPDLTGNWALSANCSWASGTVNGWFSLTRKTTSTYSFYYRNNLGETGTGTFRQNGLTASIRVTWSASPATNNTIMIAPHGRTFTGRASNNCWYSAWRS